MALSKNFTLPEKCKNHQRALRESNIDQTVFIQNCLEVVLFLRETGEDCFWPARLPLLLLFLLAFFWVSLFFKIFFGIFFFCRHQKQEDAPIPEVNFQVYFKRRRKEKNKTRKQKKKKKIQKKKNTEWKSLCHRLCFFPQKKKERENICFIKSFFLVYECSFYIFFTLIRFSFPP